MSRIKIAQLAGMKLADVVKKLKKRKYAKDSKKNVERVRGKANKSVKAYNIRAKDTETKIIPVKRQTQKGSSFGIHRVRTKMGRAAVGSEERGKLPSPLPPLARLYKRDVQRGKIDDYRLTKMYLKNKLSDVVKKKNEGGIMKRKMLTGGQAKLDKNKNNRIDAEDFKMLRAEKSKKKPIKAVLGTIAMGAMAAKMLKDKKKKSTKMPGAGGALGAGMLPGMTVADLYQKKLQGKRKGGMGDSIIDRQFKKRRQKQDSQGRRSPEDPMRDRMKQPLKTIGRDRGGMYLSDEKVKKVFPEKDAKRRAIISQLVGGDRVSPKKKDRFEEGQSARRREILKKVLRAPTRVTPQGAVARKIADKVRGKMAGGMMKPMKAATGAALGAISAGAGAIGAAALRGNKRVSDKKKAQKAGRRDAAKVQKKMMGGQIRKDDQDSPKFRTKREMLPKKPKTRGQASEIKMMGGGMMMRPMGYKAGKSVKVKCKLGRNKPTKMY